MEELECNGNLLDYRCKHGRRKDMNPRNYILQNSLLLDNLSHSLSYMLMQQMYLTWAWRANYSTEEEHWTSLTKMFRNSHPHVHLESLSSPFPYIEKVSDQHRAMNSLLMTTFSVLLSIDLQFCQMVYQLVNCWCDDPKTMKVPQSYSKNLDYNFMRMKLTMEIRIWW